MNPRTRKWMRAALGHLIGFAIAIAVAVILNHFKIPICPLKWVFDFGCPFCGMTRAHLAALTLDFKSAFAYHPLFSAAVPYLWLLAHNFLFKSKGSRILWSIAVWALTAAFLIEYILRICGSLL